MLGCMWNKSLPAVSLRRRWSWFKSCFHLFHRNHHQPLGVLGVNWKKVPSANTLVSTYRVLVQGASSAVTVHYHHLMERACNKHTDPVVVMCTPCPLFALCVVLEADIPSGPEFSPPLTSFLLGLVKIKLDTTCKAHADGSITVLSFGITDLVPLGGGGAGKGKPHPQASS